MISRTVIVAFAAAMAACFNLAGAAAQGTPDYAALIAAPDRSAADRATDARRDPLKVLTFIGARPGMKVLDMGAGGGYSTELMARAVDRTAWSTDRTHPSCTPAGGFGGADQDACRQAHRRTVAPVRRSVARGCARSRPHHLPVLLPRHDLHGGRSRQDERQAFCGAQARRVTGDRGPFGPPRHGRYGGRSLHRIEESLLRSEVEAAGFKLVGQGDFWRHPEDTHDFTTQPPTKPADEFVLKFQKPQ